MNLTSARSIPPSASRSVWVFGLDMGRELAEALVDDGPLARLLGVADIDRAHVELIHAADFEDAGSDGSGPDDAEFNDTGLDGRGTERSGILHYLHDGHGFPLDALQRDALALAALGGPVLLVFRAALPVGLGEIAPQPPLHLVGRYDEEPQPRHLSLPPAPVAGAELTAVSRKKPSDAAMSGRVATAVLLFLVLFCVAFVWMAS